MTKRGLVLHVIPHLGGGVGRFFSSIIGVSQSFDHHFLLLEEPQDVRFLPPEAQWGIARDSDELLAAIERADIIQIDFWNHPLLFQVLRDLHRWPKCRLMIYSHISGLYPPAYIPPAVAEVCDLMVFSTYASSCSDAARSVSPRYQVIPEFGGAPEFVGAQRIEHPEFRVLYVGTADPGKFNVAAIGWYVDLCRENPGLRFTFCTQDDSAHLRTLIPESLRSSFFFFEKVRDLGEFYAASDVLGYPLIPRHYGTGEQVLLEAMAAGVVPVVMDNHAERYIVDDGVTGILARDEDDFKAAIKLLQGNRNLLDRMSDQCRAEIRDNKTPERTMSLFEDLYADFLMTRQKRHHSSSFDNSSVFELFLMSQGPAARLFEGALGQENAEFCRWRLRRSSEQRSTSKGSVRHWARIFCDVKELSVLEEMVLSP